MPIQIGQHVGAGFDEPLRLLSDCHRRIEHFLDVIAKVAAASAGGPLSPDYRRALDGAVRYFEVAAPKHTADEEASLFPRLRQCDEASLRAALAALDALEHDHEEADRHHAAVNELCRRWLADDRLDAPAAAELREHVTRLQQLYERHIAIEDHDVFPAAAHALDSTQLEQIGREMAARRNAPFTPPTRPR